jgi:ribosomal protein L37E
MLIDWGYSESDFGYEPDDDQPHSRTRMHCDRCGGFVSTKEIKTEKKVAGVKNYIYDQDGEVLDVELEYEDTHCVDCKRCGNSMWLD